jgi:hypothetical protein
MGTQTPRPGRSRAARMLTLGASLLPQAFRRISRVPKMIPRRCRKTSASGLAGAHPTGARFATNNWQLWRGSTPTAAAKLSLGTTRFRLAG